MTDRDIMKLALDALRQCEFTTPPAQRQIVKNALAALRERLAHCDRCGKKRGGEGDIHTCTPKPEQPAPVQQENLSEYNSTDFGFAIAGIHVTDEAKRLIALITNAFGSDHPAFDDLMSLVLVASKAAPPQRKPLTFSKLCDIEYEITHRDGDFSILKFARAIEAAHGIKE